VSKANDGADAPAFMRDLEDRYRTASHLADRSQFRIFYGPVHPAVMLVLGINPGGDPADVMPDGVGSRSGGKLHAASAGYHENDESDVLDCDWPENRGLLKLVLPLVDDDRVALRSQMVKTNMAFRRSSKAHHIDLEAAKAEAAPFLAEIIDRVRPHLVLLAGVKLEEFTGRFCSHVEVIGEAIRDPGVKQTVFRAARVELRATGTEALVVQVAHASQFGWTYEKYGVVERIRKVWSAPAREPDARDVYATGTQPEIDPTATSAIEPEPHITTPASADAGMNVAAYEALFRMLGFSSFDSHKKLRHRDLPISIYFNRDRAGQVSFAVYAKDIDWFKPTMWDVIPARQKKDEDPKLRTVVPKSGIEGRAFRDLLRM